MTHSGYVAIALGVLLIGSIAYTLYVKFFQEKYTRERFAFASLTAATSILLSAIAQVTSNVSLSQSLTAFLFGFFWHTTSSRSAGLD